MYKLMFYVIIGEQSKISPSDKEVVRQNVLNFVAQVPLLLRLVFLFTRIYSTLPMIVSIWILNISVLINAHLPCASEIYFSLM